MSIIKAFNILRKKSDTYSNVYIKPDQSYDDRIKSKILTIGVTNKPGNIKCVFNNNTLKH